ncbi:sensor domain-containing diguanylate cyclase [Pseudodesulfovibrio aespoeensis]|uniref:sensor domain-containing diguanylate cyclase n=1 Tax=Pseudodesulfovibrio aespoeensis TaxID=182210 RepID=UPI0023545641|nr:PAS domain S-box protein [Pseudodesulfovibrio aespoeensis]MCG2734252.1 PAS domain S-box protein [Pseudodesulfovibrio aespoeensis]
MARTIREFLKLYGPLALGIILAAIWFLHSRNQDHLDLARQRQQLALDRESVTLNRAVASHASDARFLARIAARTLTDPQNVGPDIPTPRPADTTPQEPTESLPDPALQTLERIFVDFARSRSHFLQIRFLDHSGMERVRVDQLWSSPAPVPAHQLQDKKNRYYFKDALEGGPDTVSISRFDLNMEHGRIETPHRPTLRFASPVVDSAGTTLGVMVLNYDGQHLFDQIRNAAAALESLTLLCDGEGFWMLGPSTDEEWGRQLGRPEATMAVRFPEAWQAVAATGTGQALTSEGLFTFATLAVTTETLAEDSPGPATTGPNGQPAPDKARWTIMIWTPPATLLLGWSTPFTALVVLFLLVLVPGCWFLASYRVRQAEVEARLRESEERTLAISQSAQDGIVMIDDQDRVTYWNPAAERLLGYTAQEIMGRRLHPLLVPEPQQDKAESGLAGFAASGRGAVVGQVIELEAVRKDSSIVPVELAVSSVKLKGRWYAVGTLRDMTRRKRYEAALRRSEQTSRTLLNAPEDLAMLIEPNGRIAAINETGARIYERTPEDMIGRSLFDFLSDKRREALRTILSQVMEQAGPVRFEGEHDGRRFHASAYPVTGPDGAVEQMAVFARDVTEQRKAQAALKRSEQRFRDVSAAVGEYIWETDGRDTFTFVTEDVFSILGYTQEEMLGQTPALFVAREHTEDFLRWRADLYRLQSPFSKVELRCLTRDGRAIWLQSSGVPHFDDEGGFRGYRGADMDITDRKDAENAIKASERKLRALAESAYDAIVMIDMHGNASFWNRAAERLFGYTEEEVMGRPIHELITPPELRDEAMAGMRQFAGSGDGDAVGAIQETEALRKDGTRVSVERSVSSFQLGGRWYAVATIRDITERKATEARVHELATTDSLTGLFNRRRFMELAEREFMRTKRYQGALTMLMMDIDHFKRVNDTHGHGVGDEVLRELARISRTALRELDILGRLGGEEFGVLLPETDAGPAMEVAQRLRRAIEKASMATDAGTLRITVSIGAATSNNDAETVETLLKRADVALYEAKQSGRNKVVAG